jgi:adenosine deaminase
VARQGCIYAEMMVCPDFAFLSNIAYPQLIAALERGIRRAEKSFLIKGRLIILFIRHLGVQAAETLAEEVFAHPHPYVVGVTLAGDERKYAITDFSHIFRAAKAHGLGVTPHVGELRGVDEIRKALSSFPVDRLGHGLRAKEDLCLLAELAERKIHLEICLTSNKYLGLVSTYDTHPARQYFDADISISFNTDDPPFFQTSLQREYALAQHYLHFTELELLRTVTMSIESSFADSDTKKSLHQHVAHIIG